MIKQKVGIVGLGAYGNNQAIPFYIANYPTLIINTALRDLDSVTEIDEQYKYHIAGGEGCNKDRKKSKELLKKNIDNIINEIKIKLPDIEYLVIIGSAGGGSASGMLPSLKRVAMNELNIKSCNIVTVLPDTRTESVQALLNCYETLSEIEQLNEPGATYILDNSKVNDKMKINADFFKYFDSLLISNGTSKLGNVDEAEIEQLIMTPGMSIISSICKDKSNTQTLINTFSNNIFAPLEDDKVIKYIGLINADNGMNIDVKDIYERIGIPLDSYIGYEAGNYTLCILAGLSLPYTKLSEIKDIIESNKDTINHNLTAQQNNRLSDGIDFFTIAPATVKVEKKKINSRDLLF